MLAYFRELYKPIRDGRTDGWTYCSAKRLPVGAGIIMLMMIIMIPNDDNDNLCDVEDKVRSVLAG